MGCVLYLIKAVKNVLLPWSFPFLLQSTLITPFSQLLQLFKTVLHNLALS